MKKMFAPGLALALLAAVFVPSMLAASSGSQPGLLCGKAEHSHTDLCYRLSDAPVCGLAEGEGAHTHSESCYESRTVLVCTLAEDGSHSHDGSCRTQEHIPVCGEEQSAGHSHGPDCYAKELICTMEEHSHCEGCTGPAPSGSPEPAESPAPSGSPEPAESPAPSGSPEPAESPAPSGSPEPAESPAPSGSPEPAESPAPSGSPAAMESPAPSTSPAPTDGPACSCGSENDVHREDCPLYEALEAPAHIEGCGEDCTGEDCLCPCHQPSLFEQLMACETLEEFWGLLEGYTDEKLEALLNEEQLLRLNEKLDSLLPPPAPEVKILPEGEGRGTGVYEDSQIFYPTVNFSIVAPFGQPVVG